MLEQRPYSAEELLAWSRLLIVMLAGTALTYVKEHEGSVDGLIAFWDEKLEVLLSGTHSGGVENALLGLLLNMEAIGADIKSTVANAEGAEIAVGSLPGKKIGEGIEHHFEVEVSEGELLELIGTTREDLNKLLDCFGAATGGMNLEFMREGEGDTQLLKLRVW